jgi:general nucleoside transport system permease protein
MDYMNTFEIFLSTLRFSAPLILAAMAGLYCERSGVIQISLEGLMLFGAFTAAVVAHFSGNGFWGLGAAMLFGILAGALYGFLVITLKADQIVSGTIINMLAWGGIPVVSKSLFDTTSSTPALELSQRLPSWLPIVLALFVVLLTYALITKTPFGLWLTVAGEKPEALQAVGVNPKLVRWVAVMCSGAIAGLGGAVLSVCLSSSYSRNMTAGRGFMALAALILGKWRPVTTLLGCLLFGVCELLQLKLQGIDWPYIGEVPVQIVQIIPYVLTLCLLAGIVGESRAPSKLGSPS